MDYIQDIAGGVQNNNSDPVTIPITANPTLGNTLILEWAFNGSGTTPAGSLTDSKGNTWTRVSVGAEVTAPRCNVQIWMTQMDAGLLTTADTLTMDFSAIGTTNEKIWQIREFRGLLTFDKQATSQSTTSTTSIASGTTAATVSADELCVVATQTGVVEASWTKDANYTLPTSSLRSSGGRSLLSEYRNVHAAGTQAATGTIPTGTTYQACIATFIPQEPRNPGILLSNTAVL